MDISLNFKLKKLDDLCDQIFDYFHLVYYDLETKIDSELNISNFKNKLETFADKHFKSAIKDFENEIQSLKKRYPQELIKLENTTLEIKQYFNQLLNYNFFDSKVLLKLKLETKESLNKI